MNARTNLEINSIAHYVAQWGEAHRGDIVKMVAAKSIKTLRAERALHAGTYDASCVAHGDLTSKIAGGANEEGHS